VNRPGASERSMQGLAGRLRRSLYDVGGRIIRRVRNTKRIRMDRERLALAGALACWFLLQPATAWANAGLPMIMVIVPGGALTIIPVIAIEAFVLTRRLRIDGWRALGTSAAANFVSTLVGIPVTWLVLALAENTALGQVWFRAMPAWARVVAQSPWLVISGGDPSLPWRVPAALLVLLLPFFLVSWLIEYLVAIEGLDGVPRAVLRPAVLWANVASYAFLAVVILAAWAVGVDFRSLIPFGPSE
jgi:hypothetical protein